MKTLCAISISSHTVSYQKVSKEEHNKKNKKIKWKESRIDFQPTALRTKMPQGFLSKII